MSSDLKRVAGRQRFPLGNAKAVGEVDLKPLPIWRRTSKN